MEREQIETLDTNKINKLRHPRRDLIVAGPPFPTGTIVYPLLKHVIHRRFLLAGFAAAYNTLYEVLGGFNIVRAGTRGSSNIPNLPRQDAVSKDCIIFYNGGEKTSRLAHLRVPTSGCS